MTQRESVQQGTLRRARDLAGGVSFLSRHLGVAAGDLDDMIHAKAGVPSWVFLRAADFINEAEARDITPPGLPPNWREDLAKP